MDKFNLIDVDDLGIDLLKTSRIKLNDSFINRVLTPKEKEELSTKSNNNSKKQYIATVWSCKEAIFKLNLDGYSSYQNISILHDNKGKPYCDENKKIMLSISHEKKYTIAIAFLKK